MKRIDDSGEIKLSITPLIDVVFLLLIFFMCAMKFKTLERKVAAFLPKNKGLGITVLKIPPEPKISVVLQRAPGELRTRVRLLDAEIGVDEEGFLHLDERVAQIHGSPELREMPGEIDASPEVPHRDVIRCLDSFLKAGVEEVEFRGVKEE